MVDGKQSVRTISLEIFNERYNIKTDLPDADIESMRETVDKRIRTLIANHPTMNVTRAAVITALFLCEELFRLKNSIEKSNGADEQTALENQIQSIIDKIRQSL